MVVSWLVLELEQGDCLTSMASHLVIPIIAALEAQ